MTLISMKTLWLQIYSIYHLAALAITPRIENRPFICLNYAQNCVLKGVSRVLTCLQKPENVIERKIEVEVLKFSSAFVTSARFSAALSCVQQRRVWDDSPLYAIESTMLILNYKYFNNCGRIKNLYKFAFKM